MTLLQTLKAAPAKSNELLARLADTSNNAVKTREKLLAELGSELQLYLELESRQLVPVLKKHEETKGLVADAAKGAKEMRAKLAELEAAPKDGDAFLEKLNELRQSFQQHLRDERKELLPIIAKVLETEEAETLAAGMKARISEAERAKQEDARQAREAARQQSEAAEAQAEAQRASVRAQKAAVKAVRDTVDEAANVVQNVVQIEAAQEAARQIAQTATEGVEQATASVSGALVTYRHSVEEVAEDLRAISAASSLSASGLTEIRSAWSDWLNKAVHANIEATQRLLGCRNLRQVAEVQGEYRSSVVHNWMEANARTLQAAQRAAKQALKPLDERLKPNS